MGKEWKQCQTIFWGSKITADGDCSYEIKRPLLLGRKVMTNLDSIIKSRHYSANKSTFSQSYDFSDSHVWMWEMDYKENWAQKNWCFWTVVLDKILESPLDCEQIQPVHPKGDQSWMFTGGTDVEVEGHLTGSWLIWKDPDAGKRLKMEGKVDDRGWDGWMASPTPWPWVWVGSGSWWWIGRPGMLWFMGSQGVRHNWATELNWTEPHSSPDCACGVRTLRNHYLWPWH